MKYRILFTVALLGVNGFFGATADAAIKTVTLDVPGMTCSACPITVKKALATVRGVSEARVSYEVKEAVVRYDDAVTNPAALMEATRNAGYPSALKAGK